MVLSVKKSGITQLMGQVSDYSFAPPQNVPPNQTSPKYPSPTAQLDQSTLIQPGNNTYCEERVLMVAICLGTTSNPWCSTAIDFSYGKKCLYQGRWITVVTKAGSNGPAFCLFHPGNH